MELKVVCDCGQKYKFDVEPVNGTMPFLVNCPVCGVDGTPHANGLLSQMPAPAMAIPVPPPPVYTAPAAPPARRAGAAPSSPVQAAAMPKYLQTNPATQNNSFLLGVGGAVMGAILSVTFMVGVDKFFGFTMSYFALVMGAMIGFGARLMYRGTDTTLGAMAGAIAFVTIGVTLFIIDGLLGLAFDI